MQIGGHRQYSQPCMQFDGEERQIIQITHASLDADSEVLYRGHRTPQVDEPTVVQDHASCEQSKIQTNVYGLLQLRA